jgi:hypothetical protein
VAVHFLEVEYTTAVNGLPHSKQLASDRDVINPQEGQILCDCDPASCGFSLRIQWSSRVVNNKMSRPREILVTFMKTTLLGECCTKRGWAGDHSLKRLSVGVLQMDWLRSEDLKEEKNVTTPKLYYSSPSPCRCQMWRRTMYPMSPECFDLFLSDRLVAADIRLREEPDEEDDEEEKHDQNEEDDNPNEGYSE